MAQYFPRRVQRAGCGGGVDTGKVIVGLYLFILASSLASATPVCIKGEAQMEIFNSVDFSSRIVETASLVITVDGPKFNISNQSLGGNGRDSMAELGSDGVDIFMVSNRRTPFNREGTNIAAFAFPGRFPSDCSPIIQCVWLGYCSRDYFNSTTNLTGLALSQLMLPVTSPNFVTNLVDYWPDSTLPKKITGWSKNWIKPAKSEPLFEYKWYPNGFKAWEFQGADPALVGGSTMPRQLTLQGYFPLVTNDTAVLSGDNVDRLRMVTFVATSIESVTNTFSFLPSVRATDLPVIDERFTNMTGYFLLVSHVTSNEWPTRSSQAIKATMTEALRLSLQNPAYTPPRKSRIATMLIVGINLVALLVFLRVVLKTKNQNKPR